MAALVKADRDGQLAAKIDLVISPTAESPAVKTAQDLGVAVAIVQYGEGFESGLVEALEGFDWLCLAGFLRIVPDAVIHRLEGRVLNIHPSLLPKHGGKGMYGHRVHEAVLAAGDQESGCTVHWVTDGYDEGRPILQLRCPVERDDTADTLAARVLKLEHVAYAQALNQVVGERRT